MESIAAEAQGRPEGRQSPPTAAHAPILNASCLHQASIYDVRKSSRISDLLLALCQTFLNLLLVLNLKVIYFFYPIFPVQTGDVIRILKNRIGPDFGARYFKKSVLKPKNAVLSFRNTKFRQFWAKHK